MTKPQINNQTSLHVNYFNIRCTSHAKIQPDYFQITKIFINNADHISSVHDKLS